MVQACANHSSNQNGEFHYLSHTFINIEQSGSDDPILLRSSNSCANFFFHKTKRSLVNTEIHEKMNCICQVIMLPSTL